MADPRLASNWLKLPLVAGQMPRSAGVHAYAVGRDLLRNIVQQLQSPFFLRMSFPFHILPGSIIWIRLILFDDWAQVHLAHYN